MVNTLLSLYQKQLRGPFPEKPQLTVVDSRLNAAEYDLLFLDRNASRAGSCLRANGCQKGDRVLISLRETVPLWAFFWGALKLGAIPCVLFPGLGTGGLEVRLKAADACFLVTDADPGKLPENGCLPDSLKKIILLGKPSVEAAFHNYSPEDWPEELAPAEVSGEDGAFIIFTSGTTGTPKPVLHCHRIADAIVRSMRNILHAAPDDLYWCTAHPAWITGTVYGILGPVLCGIPSLQYDGSFHAKRWMPILQDRKVTLWYTAPTALRGLMREDADFFKNYDFSALEQIYSIGEPLPERVFEWGRETFGQPIYDTWFQTETGTIRIANQPGGPIRPGWMGKPADDTEVIAGNEGTSGKLLLKAGFGSMFREYYGMPEATAEKIHDGCFETGDLVCFGADGYLRYEGRADDVINTSGHLVGPLEVENVLTSNQEVAEAAVVPEADELLYEAPVAYLVLAEGAEWSKGLETALKVAVNGSVSVYAVPKRFYVVDSLPHTMSGKIDRGALRRRIPES